MTPTAFGHYTVIRSLGSGGMADVYLAHDPSLGRQVAIKAPHPEFFSGEGRARFAREARAAATLEHFAIVPIYDYNDQGQMPYMVMRYLTGGALDDRIAHRPMHPAAALPILERIAAALDYAHGRGVIHRDVKSANILFDDKDNAYLSDFGIAWMAAAGESNRLTATGTVRGTFDYISPEQAQGIRDLDGRADLYSLAVVLFEMLTGDVPYRAESGLLVAAQHISAPVPDIRSRRPDLPPGLSAVMGRALAKRRDDRYPTGAALVADLQRALTGQRVATPPRSPTPRPTPTPTPGGTPSGRMTWLWAIVAVVALAVAAFALLRPTGSTANEATPVVQVPTATSNAPDPTSTVAAVTEVPPTVAPEPTVDDRSAPVVLPPLPDEIVFQSNRDGDYEIFIMNVDGSDQRQLTSNTAEDRYPRVSPDGQHIVFQSRANDNTDIYVMNRDGTDLTRLTSAESLDELPSWSPDGREILFNSWLGANTDSSDLFVIDVGGGEPQRLTETAINEAHADWSSTGRLVFNGTVPGEDFFQIYTSHADMSNGQQITNSQIDEYSPQWSPDGTRILFISERGNSTNSGLYSMNADGSDARLLYNGPTEEWGASWSADGTQIIFTIDQPDGTANIYIMDAGGGEPGLVTERGGYPSWAAGTLSPDGEITISATTARTSTGLMLSAGQPVVIEVAGGGWRAGAGDEWPAVGGGGDPQVASKPAFPVPDRPIMTLVGGVGGGAPFAVGERLAFTAAADGELWLGPNDDNPADNDGSLTVRVTLDGRTGQTRGGGLRLAAPPIPLSGDGLVQLTFVDEAHTSHYTAVFAPDQSRILMSVEMGDDWQVFEADPNGGGLGRQLTSGPYDHYQAALSPDGRSFLTSANRDGDGDIYLFDAATGEMLQQLTNDHALDYHPRWLPDGESFIYSADDEGSDNDEIFLMTLDGRRTQLTDDGTYDGFATPSADGQYIAFYSNREGDHEIYVMDIDGGNPRRLTISAGRDASPSFSPDGRWVVFESERGGRYEIYAMPFEGGETTRLTDSDGDNYFPIISPDGQWLMFQSTRGGNMEVYRQPWTLGQ
ncbi:putative Mitogen-activated protein kinase kinase kinase [Candidatus Promineifilum breve]|uniref:Mitogen-activated protein kinase kinase kinase n=1 Tax=Candidatus Promineifilum breve TaxID=1806508 RepID=A0A160T870_9CHLR|nr:protein kinase [Candidatus Promineifilum breve]CUS05588.1 putative Mitogen-activated protein kinase kinase kinase [Candidatus Promineifilum breve]